MISPWYYNKTFLANNADLIKGRVVDIGCGRCKYKDFILSLPQVEDYTGVDLYAQNADILADLNKKLPICISVLEHVLEPQNALKEIFRILKPKGYLLLSVPWIYPYHGEPNDYYRYSLDCLKYLLKKTGFEIVHLSSTGGKMRVIWIFFQKWFPLFKKLWFMDKLLSLFKKRDVYLDTPDYQIVAKKIK